MKAILDSIEGLPEAIAAEYEEKGGKFHLKLEGSVPGMEDANGKIAEFRDHNIALRRQMDELKEKYNGVDTTEYKALKEKAAELEKRGIKGGGDITTLIQEAIKPLQAELVAMRQSDADSKAALARKDLETTLTREGLKAGVAEYAIPDFIRRGLEVFVMEDGKPVAKNGAVPLFSKVDASVPLAPGEWVSGLVTDAPHLFRSSTGGDAGGDGDKGDAGKKTYDPNDHDAMLKNTEAIAKREMVPREN